MRNCFLTGDGISGSVVVTLPTHHHMHGVEYFELIITFVTADLATNGDALPKTNTFTRLELSVNLVFIEGFTCEKLRQAILPPLCSATACYVCSRSVRA